jgi:hypothetical protein
MAKGRQAWFVIFPDAFGSPFLSIHEWSTSANFTLLIPLPLLSTSFAMEKKITEKIAALPPDANYFSLEFFPPKTRMVG